MGLDVKEMQIADLHRALGWARDEGWNPGLDDAEAFHSADPAGFLMGWLGQDPVCAISVVRYGPDAGFLGLYLCRSEFRGQGHGWTLWQAGMARMEHRLVGLDGVVAQQENYRRSGFNRAYRNIRMIGHVDGAAAGAPFDADDLSSALALDAEITGLTRPKYLRAWWRPAPTRKTKVLRQAGRVVAVGTIRRCIDGGKIGPLLAQTPDEAILLLSALCAEYPGAPVSIDVPEPNAVFLKQLEGLGFSPAFETARMYKGVPPVADMARLFGQTTLELG